jgi:hypothetical protein
MTVGKQQIEQVCGAFDVGVVASASTKAILSSLVWLLMHIHAESNAAGW